MININCKKITSEFIYNQIQNGKSIKLLAKELNCSTTILYRRLKNYQNNVIFNSKKKWFS